MKKRITIWFIGIILLNLLGITASAAWANKDAKTYDTNNVGQYVTGWQDIGGKTYYFEQDGSMATKSKTIDGIRYKFHSDGVCGGKYSGWVKDSKYKYYYKDGAKQTGWLQSNGNKYYLNRDGIMRTGSVSIWLAEVNPKNQFVFVYHFDENGVWDRNGAKHSSDYKPETVGDFLLDHDFPVSGKYDANVGNGKFKEFAGIETALDILRKHSDVKLLYDDRISYDEIELNNAVHRGRNDIFVRLRNVSVPGLAAPGLHFSKDKAGSSYFYCNYYNFGIKLDDKDAYDKIARLIKS